MRTRSRSIVLLSTLVIVVTLSAWKIVNVLGDPKKADRLKIPPGFKAEHLYSPSANGQGSWVGMTWDDKGRMITVDQYGGLYRLVIPKIGEAGDVKVEKLI